jgi:hypothetical protein
MIIVEQGKRPAHGSNVIVVNSRDCIDFPEEMIVLDGTRLETKSGRALGVFETKEIAVKVLRDIVNSALTFSEVYCIPNKKGEGI